MSILEDEDDDRWSCKEMIDKGKTRKIADQTTRMRPRETFEIPPGDLLLDSINFGLRESEFGHHGYADFAVYEGPPQNRFKDESYFKRWFHEVRSWREQGGLIGFELLVPKQTVLKGLHLEICCKRYDFHIEKTFKPIDILIGTWTKLFSLGVVDFPFANKWLLFDFDLALLLPDRFENEQLVVFIDNRANVVDEHSHFGISIAHTKLYCRDRIELKPVGPKIEPLAPAPIDGEVLLVVCPVWDTKLPPISVACIASYLRERKVDVAVFDYNIEGFTRATYAERRMWYPLNISSWFIPEYVRTILKKYEAPIENTVIRIIRAGVKIVAFSIYASNLEITLAAAARLKKNAPQILIVFGGPGVVFVSREKLGDDWDYCIVGEGEGSLYDVIAGRAASNQSVLTPASFPPSLDLTRIKHSEMDLNKLPLLDYSGFDLNLYEDIYKLPAFTSRGCVRRCAYCFDSIFYSPYRFMNGERAYRHLTGLHERHGRTYFELSDLLINGDLDALGTMARLLKKADLGLSWGGFAIIRKDMSSSYLDRLKAAGCDYMRFGFETGCETHLKAMKRGYSTLVAAETLKKTKQAGIKTYINLLVGFPGETDATIEETIVFLKNNAAFIDRVETVNAIALMPEVDLRKRSDIYGIDYDPASSDWKTSGHDVHQRMRWAGRVHAAIKELGIKVYCDGIIGSQTDFAH